MTTMEQAADGDLILRGPEPTEYDWKDYESNGFEPLFFEWYKSVASILNLLSAIQPDSPAFQCSDPRHYYVLSGLMHRCVRLMTANVALSHQGRFGETAAIVDRSLCESAIKVQWLCAEDSDERILRFLTDSLRPELEFEAQIKRNVEERHGVALPIETRMLTSIQNHITAAGVTRDDIRAGKRLPDMAAMLESIGHGRLAYIVVQRMGSHHIHGTWPNLLSHYLEETTEFPPYRFKPKHSSIPMHVNQYVHGSRFALEAGVSFSRFFLEAPESDDLAELCMNTLDKMLAHYRRATADDYR
jgi:hypothetical protein